jgi:hypothetical protein
VLVCFSSDISSYGIGAPPYLDLLALIRLHWFRPSQYQTQKDKTKWATVTYFDPGTRIITTALLLLLRNYYYGIGRQRYELSKQLQDLHVDVALFSETHLKHHERFFILNFHFYRTDRYPGRKGGTAVAVKKAFPM